MRIALVHNVPTGGAKRAIFEWTRRLASRHHVGVFTFSTAAHDFCDVRPFVTQHFERPFQPSVLFRSPFGRLNQLQRWRDLGRLDRLWQAVADSIDDRGYDVVLVNTCQFTCIPPILRQLSTPTVYYLHEPCGAAQPQPPCRVAGGTTWRSMADRVDPLLALYRRRLDQIQRESLQRATRLLANSRFTRTQMQVVYRLDAAVCPCGVDADMFRPLPVRRGGHVLSVGELSPRKGFDFLVESLSRLPIARRPALRLACNSGQADERRYVEDLAAAKGVALTIRVALDPQALVSEYNEAALCVYSPVHEPFGLVPLEAMACETAVIAVREGGVPDSVVHERTGLLTERDPAEFARAVDTLLSAPTVARMFGAQGRAHVLAHWTWDQSVRALETNLVEVATAGQVSVTPRRRQAS